jgi:polyhydroxyalkanoate synthase
MSEGKEQRFQTASADEFGERAAAEILGPNPFVGLRREDILATAQQIAHQAGKYPLLAIEQQAALARDAISILAGSCELAPAQGDKRFQDAAWTDNPLYRIYLQGYLAWTKALGGFVDRSDLEGKSKERARYVVSLLTEALAPSNTLLGNPAALKKLLETGGASAVKGLQNMFADLFQNQGMPAQVDKKAFAVGKNLAVSPGAVVFRNAVLELIQYAPATEQIFGRPQLIVPPQINKFYIFDLAPGKSIIEYLVNGGFQVFAVSWRNPTPEQRDWSMETYVQALLEAITAVREITGSEDVNLHGACSGAMTMSALLAHLAAKRQRLVHAATLMVAILDSSEESQIGLFATPEAIAAAKHNSASKGVLEGMEMGRVFAWMRPNDLVWNYWVNNYLLGNSPPVFDILYWNCDSTRLAAKFHAELLDVFADNTFRRPGALKILGTPIDLSKVNCDKYVLAGMTDHITPWKAVYNAARLFGGRSEFVLSSSGHIQSIINPPGNAKAKFFVNPDSPARADAWLENAQATSGSWWEHWRQWLAERSGEMREAPQALGSERHIPGVKAPGRYVIE